MKRLDLGTWENIFRNIKETVETGEAYDGIEWVEILWLDPGDSSEGEWCLAYGEELFEDGFVSEREAQERLTFLENALL